MARNIVQEKREAERTKALAEEDAKALEIPNLETLKPTGEEKIVYITTEQVMLNNLNVIMAQLDNIYAKMLEGFKQVGVVFEDKKE